MWQSTELGGTSGSMIPLQAPSKVVFGPGKRFTQSKRQERICTQFSRKAENDKDVREVMNKLEQTSSIISSNPAFAEAFQGALQRQGLDALTRQQKRLDEKRPSPAEEVLLEGLRQSRRNILKLENMQTAIEISLEEENKQFERIQFALKRANSDAAYIRTLEKLRHELKERLQDLGERV